jgi:hypothetical protein
MQLGSSGQKPRFLPTDYEVMSAQIAGSNLRQVNEHAPN